MNGIAVLPDALRAALGQIIADQRREWKRDRELVEAETAKILAEAGRAMAECKMKMLELMADFEKRAGERLAALKDGRDGVDGEPGPAGPQGGQGATGEQGPPGLNGRDGRDGVDGMSIVGATGPQGSKGDAGPRGEQGPPGEPGREWQAMGLYEPDLVYRRGNVVALEGGSFVALKDDPGPCPGDDWRQIVGRGKAGPRGDRGERGPPGPPAPIQWTIDPRQFTINATHSDGTKDVLELRPLFEQYHADTHNT